MMVERMRKMFIYRKKLTYICSLPQSKSEIWDWEWDEE